MRSPPTHGAALLPGGGVRFRLWAPGCASIALAIGADAAPNERHPMRPAGDGWHELDVPEGRPGTRYQFILPAGLRVPDPASRFQPDDVNGASEVIDPNYPWRDAKWHGRPWHEAIIYELHVGTFTDEGTFRAAALRLAHLARLGVTAIELMPVADFPGRRNWGYDGVLLYAPDATYGRPEDLKAFVDEAHAHGIMVFLDVVYNHFGPAGNYLSTYAPSFFNEGHRTPWGAAINYDAPGSAMVREFVVQNALYWIDEFHFDGLRLDAVHTIVDHGPTHLLDELADRLRQGRSIHLVLENEENQVRRLVRDANGTPLQFTAQWNDDVHHVLHVAATGEQSGYYADYHGAAHLLGRALAEGFAFQGEMMAYRGAPRGEPSAQLPPVAFIAFIQNHDQIGNRARGERISTLAGAAASRAVASVLLLLPQIPMLFMGEEWQTVRPFPFFCDFDGQLGDAVRDGRRAEFAKFPEFHDASLREAIPDPQAESTFRSAILDWAQLNDPGPAAVLGWYRRLLTARREVVVPLLPLIGAHAGRYEVLGDGAVIVRWRNGADDCVLTLAANLSDRWVYGFPTAGDRQLWQEGLFDGTGAAPWSVRWSIWN